jgi:GTPase Era involved in 16S rRNA processing
VSPKKHTTTRSIAGVFTQGTRQIILMDTPGVIPYQVGRKWRASKSFLTGPQRSLLESHLALVVVDASDKKMRHELDKELMQALTRYSHIPAILILNKVDIVRHKHTLLHITENLTGAAEKWMREDMQKRAERKKTTLEKPPHMSDESVEKRKPDPDFLSTADPSASPGGGVGDLSTQEEESHAAPVVETFSKVFMVSALTGDGVPDLREYLLTCTRPGLWEYSVAVQSDQSELALVEDIVREKLLQHLHREIPYVITQTNLIWEREGDTLMIYQNLTCRSKNQASIVIGPAGSTIQTITAEAKDDVEALLGCPVDLTLNVKTHK